MNPLRQFLRRFHYVFLLWTFPGVVIHELAHKEFCRYYHIPVKEVCYFQLDQPAGYVVHGRPRSYIVAFVISIAPVFVNTTVAFTGGLVFAWLYPFESFLVLIETPIEKLLGAFLAGWIGISAGVHALPSRQDAREIWSQTRDNWYNPFVLAVIPIVLLIEILNRLRPFYFHVIAGIVIFALGVFTGLNYEVVIEFIRGLINMEHEIDPGIEIT